MTARGGHQAASFEAAPGYVQRVSLEDGRASVSLFWMRCVDWLGEPKNKKDILYRLSEPGGAMGYSAPTFQDQADALLKHESPTIRESASVTLFFGSCGADKYLVIPDPVAAHVLDGGLQGHLWACAFRDRIELWSEAVRARKTAKAVSQINDFLDETR